MKTAAARQRGVEHDIVQTPQVGDVSPYYEPQGDEVAIFEAAYKRRLPIMLRPAAARRGFWSTWLSS